jgi:branched-subunit amino acid aminotransferase/4-amino-4-deoxychorismate lyase
VESKECSIRYTNRGLRYGDGLFETIKITDNKSLNLDLHFRRMLATCSEIEKSAYIIETLSTPKIDDNPYFMISKYKRDNNLGVVGKCSNSLQFVLAKIEAKENNCFDSLMLNSNGYICEFSSGNIFWSKIVKSSNIKQYTDLTQNKNLQIGDVIYFTPSIKCGIVDGVQRHNFIKKNKGFVIDGSFKLRDLNGASKIFFTNVSCGVVEIKGIL